MEPFERNGARKDSLQVVVGEGRRGGGSVLSRGEGAVPTALEGEEGFAGADAAVATDFEGDFVGELGGEGGQTRLAGGESLRDAVSVSWAKGGEEQR